MIRKSSRTVARLLTLAALSMLLATEPESRTPAGAQQGKAASKSTRRPARQLTVHEWGTFTAIAGRDGKPLEWRPLVGPSDLPSFVYDLGGVQEGKGLRHGYQCFKCQEATIRMETPVLYFYADRETTLS